MGNWNFYSIFQIIMVNVNARSLSIIYPHIFVHIDMRNKCFKRSMVFHFVTNNFIITLFSAWVFWPRCHTKLFHILKRNHVNYIYKNSYYSEIHHAIVNTRNHLRHAYIHAREQKDARDHTLFKRCRLCLVVDLVFMYNFSYIVPTILFDFVCQRVYTCVFLLWTLRLHVLFYPYFSPI